MKTRKYGLGVVIGYRKDGRPIRLQAGGSVDVPPAGIPGSPIQPNPPIAGDVPPVVQPVAPVAPGTQVPEGPRLFTEEEVARFRQQERDKLYTTLEELKAKVGTFEAERAALRQAEEERKKAEEDAARKAREDELSARQLFEQQREEMEARFAALQAEREQERAALEKEREFAALQAFIQRRVREEQQAETIAPELLDLVDGSSEEEVEARIKVLQEKTSAMVSNMQAVLSNQPAPRGVSAAGYAAVGPMENQSVQRQITPEELRAMPMSEYSKIRDQILGQAAHSNRGQGLFG